jgi:hypothetical protein
VAVATLILLHIAFFTLIWSAPTLSFFVDSRDVKHEQGRAYLLPEIPINSLLYEAPADSAQHPNSSKLQLFENGVALGPGHSSHADIRDFGGGTFSHWGNTIYFSTSDGTDPTTNNRVYSISTSTELKNSIGITTGILLALADLVPAFLLWPHLLRFLKRRYVFIAAGVVCCVIIVETTILFFSTAPIVVAKIGPPKDPALALAAFKHALLGVATSLGIWAAGAGITRAATPDSKASLPRILIPAFPVALGALALLVSIALLIPAGRLIALACWVLCLIPLRKWRPPREQLAAFGKAVLAIVPFSMALGIWLAVLWHGPTDTLSGRPSGDLTFYASQIWSLAIQPYPHYDLAYAGASTASYFNDLFPALGAALLYLPGFDPFLFLLASGGTSYLLFSALLLHLYATDRMRVPASTNLALLTFSVVIAVRYPYWIVESIPMVFVPALTISVWWMAQFGRTRIEWSVGAALCALVGSILSKVTTAALLVPLASTAAWPRLHLLPRSVTLAIFAVLSIFAAYSAIMLVTFFPAIGGLTYVGPESVRMTRWYFVTRDIGAVLMIPLGFVIATPAVALSLTLGLLTFLCFSWVFQVNFVCTSIILGLLSVQSPIGVRANRLAWMAFILPLPAVMLADPAGVSTGVIWAVCVSGAVLSALVSAKITFRASVLTAVTVCSIIVVGLIGIGRGTIIADLGSQASQARELTPALKEIWSEVRNKTPTDALIFTDQVDGSEDLLGGWNTYACAGQRQLFLSSYFTNAELRYNPLKLAELLALNTAVLDGRRAPESVPVKRTYSAYFGVIASKKRQPLGWQLIYRNEQYALYKIG